MIKQKRIFVIHGWEGNSKSNWLPWLKKELKKKNFKVIIRDFPNTKKPKLTEWLAFLEKIVSSPDKNTYFIGHSLGVITILKYLEGLKEDVKIGGAILVAGFPEKLKYKELNNFFKKPLNYKEIKKHCKKFIAINSDNDKYVPLKNGKILKKNLGAKLIIKKGMGHFNAENGATSLPLVIDSLLNIQ